MVDVQEIGDDTKLFVQSVSSEVGYAVVLEVYLKGVKGMWYTRANDVHNKGE